MNKLIMLLIYAMVALPSLATDKPTATSPAALEHSQAKSLKVSKIADCVDKTAVPLEISDRHCCCSVSSGCNNYGCLVCGCSFCPLDKEPDPNKTLHPNSQWRVPELINSLR